MFNLLFNPKKARRHPLEMLFIGMFYSTLSILLSIWIFPEYSSIVMVFFTVISCLYVVQGAIKLEEGKEFEYKSEVWLLREHARTIEFLLMLFFGFVFSYVFWTIVLPGEKVLMIFSLQASVVEGIRNMVATGNSISDTTFFIILWNNLKVMIISLIFAFFYGAGAIFVLVWNASVMGYVIGEITRNQLGIAALPFAFLKYFLHGIPEMLAYLVIALAGGIIYVSLWKGDLFDKTRVKKILLDTFVLLVVSVVLLVVAAFIEVFISPLI